MRVTEGTQFDLVRETLRKSKGKMEGLQGQLSSLKKLNQPSDDPVGAAKILEVRTDRVNNEQFLMNAKLAESMLQNSDHALSELGDIIVRAKEIAIGQSSGASANADTRLAIGEEVNQLFQQAVSGMNRRVGDRYLFGGYKTNNPPFGLDGEYKGDRGQMMTEVGRDVFVAMNIPGVEAINSSPPPVQKSPAQEPDRTLANADSERQPSNNVNLFQELNALRTGLLTNDNITIRGTLDRFDQIFATINGARAKIGSRINGIQNLSQSLERQHVTQSQLSSHLEDADMAQVTSELAKEETVFRSALQSSQKLIQPTLLDFLK